jgi:hypothetical protein
MASRGGPTKAGGRERGLQKWQVSLASWGCGGVRLILGSLILECLDVFEGLWRKDEKRHEGAEALVGRNFSVNVFTHPSKVCSLHRIRMKRY